MTKATIYHNPRCSKSRQALALLEAHGCEIEEIRYLDNPPDAAALRRLLGMLGIGPAGLLRHKEPRLAELGLDPDAADDDTLIDAMLANPVLIERPLVVVDGRACIGRPPENVLGLLEA